MPNTTSRIVRVRLDFRMVVMPLSVVSFRAGPMIEENEEKGQDQLTAKFAQFVASRGDGAGFRSRGWRDRFDDNREPLTRRETR
jgi:hypothetical protein